MRPNRGMMSAGLTLLLTSYAAAFFSGVTFAVLGNGPYNNNSSGSLAAGGGVLIIPIVGPFVSGMVFRELAWALPWALVDGAIQVTGLALTIAGAKQKKKVAVLASDRVRLSPWASSDGGGFTLSGRF
jgi:hypothetical protein